MHRSLVFITFLQKEMTSSHEKQHSVTLSYERAWANTHVLHIAQETECYSVPLLASNLGCRGTLVSLLIVVP